MPEHWGKPLAADRDDRHLRVLFSQCQEVIERVRRNAARNGTSIRLTYQLQRLRQLLRRSEQLLDILAGLLQQRSSEASAYPPIVSLFTQPGARRVPAQQSRPTLAPEYRTDCLAGDRQRQPPWRALHYRNARGVLVDGTFGDDRRGRHRRHGLPENPARQGGRCPP
jgi:hypothetical protein